jgi:acyl carrier protein
MTDLERTVHAVVRQVAEDRSIPLETVRNELKLVEDVGLKSLDLARVVAKLELKLGADPFAEMVAITSIRTVGDLCAAYARCFPSPGRAEPPDASADFLDSKTRAASRLGAAAARRRARRAKRIEDAPS